ncbi:MAG TPA: glycosyltransferase family 4 protein [Thermoanaerobaculia bacterium]|nr:glycosyltransferase family 4 protein [Thermoanaerobaculia bacterium]
MPRIAMLTSEYPPELQGGLGTHVYELVKGLSRLGHEIFVLAYTRRRAAVERDGNVTVCLIPLPEGSAEEFGYRELLTLNDRLVQEAEAFFARERTAPDILHCHDWFGFPGARRLRESLRAPVVTTLHFLGHPSARRWGQEIPEEVVRHEREACTDSDALIAVSEAMARSIRDDHGVPADRVTVVYNGFDPTPFLETIDPAELEPLRRRFAPNGEKVVMFAGRFVPMKGISALLRSAVRIAAEREDVTWVLAGEHLPGRYTEHHLAMARSHPQLGRRAFFPGRVSRAELVRLYRLARMAVVPSLWEPFGYAATEAMAAGVPTIATDTGGLSEIVEPERSGILVPLRELGGGLYDVDLRKLAEAQTRLLDDDALATRLGAAGRARVLERFRWETMIERTAAVYAAVTGR